MATRTKTRKKKKPVVSRAIKPGSYEEYLWNHPEEMDRLLREYGVDVKEFDHILENGGGKIPIDLKKARAIKKKTRISSRTGRPRYPSSPPSPHL